ncbi:FMN-dependent dehydrogenase-domain-containing protein [Truncatella angustata]|uniref:L-lactate dehydrogenase (cytochrome) n=1 Tax=Truncatella angustata TaxID=152316 RepID=A0A9P8UFX7_9PEZI|nr:FMN-dependent dehydrogenase-domain-containing protein [Truncatella angustata]KAH6649150.1 FMN-dependent dehydrogenase-domain-containing protein [Truncatella angustata]
MQERSISAEEISQHASLHDLWVVVDSVVYDVTAFAPEHPGGVNILLQHGGRDATAAYSEVHSASLIKTSLPSPCHIGRIDAATITKSWTAPLSGSASPQKKGGTLKPPLESLICAHDFELAAEKSFTPKAWAFASSAATDCYTKDRNRGTYRDIILRPRILTNVKSVDRATTMLGHKIHYPIFCSATSMGKMFHPQGEREIGRACKSLGIPQMVSTSASYSFLDIMNAHREGDNGMTGGVPVFFQLYMDKNREKSKALLKHVTEQGAKAIFLTVDAPVTGKREADERVKADESIGSPMTGVQAQNDEKGGALGRIMGGFIDPTTAWDDIAWIRECAPGLAVILKGVQTASDAVMAMHAGVDGILLSNHGGRSLDTSPATILVLLELQKCCPEVFDKLEVYVDGGISRGTDIFKALCLGAKAVGIGRGFLYALNYGQEGIKHYINILNDELETTMRMCGITSLDQVHPGLLHTGAVDHLIPSGESHPYARWSPRMKSKL